MESSMLAPIIISAEAKVCARSRAHDVWLVFPVVCFLGSVQESGKGIVLWAF